ncbi:MAG: diacylglycerol kinase [Burkholderiaceae bacterium]|nr:diacylglycerol kinase [Burkholderiaceae bacterium]
MPAAPLYVVLNAGSGHEDTETTSRAIADVFNAVGRTHEIFRVDDPKQLGTVAQQAVAKAKQNSGSVVAAGGDGTLNTVAQATLGSGCLFGVIPSGTFNYFGRTHGISSDTSVAARALLTARVQHVQVGMVNDRVFLVNASIGLHPQLLEDREEQKHRHGRSRLVAAWAALVTIIRGYRPMLIKLDSDGRKHQLRTLTLFVVNNRLQLEQMGLESEVVEQEGKLAAIVLGPVSKLSLLWLALQGALGRLREASGVQRFSLTKLVVTPANRLGRRLKVATDGEVTWMNAPIEFRVAPQPLLLLVPIDAEPETAKR